MTTTMPREVGRPRVFSDDVIFQATQLTLAREGYGRLTLDAIAKEIGCTRQALVRRFGSKHALVLAYLNWSLGHVASGYRQVRDEAETPLGALRARFLWPAEQRPREIGDPTSQANILSFFIGARDDPEFAQRLAEINQVYEAEISSLLQAAIDQGELHPATDPAKLAHLLFAGTTGEVVLWAAYPQGDVVERLGSIFDATVAPYLTGDSAELDPGANGQPRR
ncbi:MAG: TetR/AcrR family transcriptional regulator [Thermomicrobiales bacterium]|nr:TetR/AcrR family transcriptional regulator [Thermomicrobiales bacterium]MCO5223101.1 TetR/AcrR family transcriptional regulator [Thermomicrobiales bacterium]